MKAFKRTLGYDKNTFPCVVFSQTKSDAPTLPQTYPAVISG